MLKPCNTENMQKFVDALRSGNYVQGQNALERMDASGKMTNCCLGVACRVAIANGLALEVIRKEGVGATHFDEETAFLPKRVKDWLGVETGNPVLKAFDPDTMVEGVDLDILTATFLNDTHNYTFSQIADAFERTYLTA